MGDSDRDPLFFPPGKTPQQDENAPPGPITIEPERQEKALLRLILLGTAALAAVLVVLKGDTLRRSWSEFIHSLPASSRGASKPVTMADLEQVLHESPQLQAEDLLQLDLQGNQATVSPLIQARLDQWRHHLTPSERLRVLIHQAMNSDASMQVRADGVEVHLAAYGIEKTPQAVESLIRQAEPGQQYRAWALWTLACLGNRGVSPGRVHETLMASLHDPQPDIRRWAAESVAILGDDGSVPALLESLHGDPSLQVRERAAAGIAVNGMLTREQRMSAVPELLKDLDDPALDPTTRSFIFHILRDLSHQSLPDDPTRWRAWYASTQATRSRP